MTNPVHSVRVAPEHRDILTTVAALIRQGQAEALRAALSDWPGASPVGPFRDEGAALTFFRDRLVTALKPRQLWLFGSRARGHHRADSDFDFLVVLEQERAALAHDSRRLAEAVIASGVPVDVLGCTEDEFERARDMAGTVAHLCATEGRLLYERRW